LYLKNIFQFQYEINTSDVVQPRLKAPYQLIVVMLFFKSMKRIRNIGLVGCVSG